MEELVEYVKKGKDDEGNEVNMLELWDSKSLPQYYANAAEYWEKVDATDNGMLGGFAKHSKLDIKGSLQFYGEVIRQLATEKISFPSFPSLCADCGAGIGRITKNFLAKKFDEVHLVEMDFHFIEKAKKNLRFLDNSFQYFCISLADFVPSLKTYDLIWVQWVTGYLTDDHFIRFLKRSTEGLKENGIIVLKENINGDEAGFVLDPSDSSITRTDKHFRKIIEAAELELFHFAPQQNWPKSLFAINMYALRRRRTQTVNNNDNNNNIDMSNNENNDKKDMSNNENKVEE